MAEKELYEIERKDDRQHQIEHMEVGDSVSLARRIDLSFGLADGTVARHSTQLRGILDQQTHRARRRNKAMQFKVENGNFITRDGALMVIAICTRME